MTLTLNTIGLARGGTPLVSGLDLEIHPGQCLWLQGPNGSGKTTFLEFMAGLHPAQTGSVEEDGHTFFFLSTSTPLDPKITVQEHLTFWGRCLNNSDSIESTLRSFSLQDLAHKASDQLSWGQKKRLLLSILTLIPHTVWLLDEPFTGLDQTNRERLTQLCQGHLEKGGILITAHHEDLPLQAHQTLRFPALKEDLAVSRELAENWAS
ncbi:MAG: heme ABC exporter ATP-binding protein CcmA [bacterium]|nr:heme ABC exporter ATP-binding protein CcmA [bacterium]